MKTNIVDVSPPIPYLANILALELWAKILPAKSNFGHADKHRSFQQVDTIILGVCSQVWPKYSK